MTPFLASLLLASGPALARIRNDFPEVDGLPGGELAVAVLTVMMAAWRWWNRAMGDEEADPSSFVLRSSGLSGAVGEEAARARAVARILAIKTPGADREEEPEPGQALGRWYDALSEPLLLELVQALHAALLRRRVEGGFANLEPLLLPGAREALLQLAGVEAVERVVPGPVRLVDHTADEVWTVVEVEAWTLLDERWQGEGRTRLRRDRLRLRRATRTPTVPLPEAIGALADALSQPQGPALAPEALGGWVLAHVVESEVHPVTRAALRRLDSAGPAGRPSRTPVPGLDERLAELAARHPDDALPTLLGRVRDLALRSLAARQPDAPPDPTLDAVLAGPARALHPFWRAAQAAAPPLTSWDGEDLLPGACGIGELRPLDLRLDACFELVAIGVAVAGPPPPWAAPGMAGHHHEEVWLLGLPLDGPPQWQVLDIHHAPVPTAPR